MFERYTEQARRVIFFARYEASAYGSKEIATEHLLLGLMREDRALLNRFLDTKARVDLREEIERAIQHGKRISTAVEVPLSAESRKALNLASEEADRLKARYIGTEHLLLGLLGVTGSLAEHTLTAHGIGLDEFRHTLTTKLTQDLEPRIVERHSGIEGLAALTSFLEGLSSMTTDELIGYFSDDVAFIDSQGKRWRRSDIAKSFGVLFASYAKKNATYVVEDACVRTDDTLVVTILWKNALLASGGRGWMQRMGMAWVLTDDDWRIGFVQVTIVTDTRN